MSKADGPVVLRSSRCDGKERGAAGHCPRAPALPLVRGRAGPPGAFVHAQHRAKVGTANTALPSLGSEPRETVLHTVQGDCSADQSSVGGRCHLASDAAEASGIGRPASLCARSASRPWGQLTEP